jgi:hypothetical protein
MSSDRTDPGKKCGHKFREINAFDIDVSDELGYWHKRGIIGPFFIASSTCGDQRHSVQRAGSDLGVSRKFIRENDQPVCEIKWACLFNVLVGTTVNMGFWHLVPMDKPCSSITGFHVC